MSGTHYYHPELYVNWPPKRLPLVLLVNETLTDRVTACRYLSSLPGTWEGPVPVLAHVVAPSAVFPESAYWWRQLDERRARALPGVPFEIKRVWFQTSITLQIVHHEVIELDYLLLLRTEREMGAGEVVIT